MHSIKNNHLRFVQKCEFSHTMRLIKILSKYMHTLHSISYLYTTDHYTIYINFTRCYTVTVHAYF